MRSSTVFPRPISSASTPPRTSSDAPNASSETWPVCQLTYAAGGGEAEEAEDAAFSTARSSPSRLSGRHSGCVAAAPRPEPANHPYPASSSPTSSSLARSPRFVSAAKPPFSRRIIHSTARRWYPRGVGRSSGKSRGRKDFCAGERASRDSPARGGGGGGGGGGRAASYTPRIASSSAAVRVFGAVFGSVFGAFGDGPPAVKDPSFSVAAFGIVSSPPRISSVAAREGGAIASIPAAMRSTRESGGASHASAARSLACARRRDHSSGCVGGWRNAASANATRSDDDDDDNDDGDASASSAAIASSPPRTSSTNARAASGAPGGRSASHDVDEEEAEAAAVAGATEAASGSIGESAASGASSEVTKRQRSSRPSGEASKRTNAARARGSVVVSGRAGASRAASVPVRRATTRGAASRGTRRATARTSSGASAGAGRAPTLSLGRFFPRGAAGLGDASTPAASLRRGGAFLRGIARAKDAPRARGERWCGRRRETSTAG